MGPNGVSVDSAGKFLYVANSGKASAGVSAYAINPSTGALTSISGSPFAAGTSPEATAVDPTGKFVYVANHIGNTVSAYTINSSTGALSAMSGSPFAAGSSPSGIVIAAVTGP
jgi:DNA-binding beta-propeller fold protein YncE